MNNRILRNILVLFSGQSLASVIGLINMVILIKSIGLEGNGVIAITISYANIFNSLFNFQSFNAVIKYGAKALEEKDKYRYKQYIKQAVLQDIVTAIIAFIIAFICVNFISELMNWDSQIVLFIKIYLVTILVNITGSIMGVLRLHDKFKIIASISIKTNTIKLLCIIIGFIRKMPLAYYIIIEIIVCLIGNLMMFKETYKVMKQEEILDFWKVKILFDKEFTQFNFYNNIVSTIDLPVGQLVTFIIDKFLGVTEVGIYSVLIKIGGLISKVTYPISQVIYPELSKQVAKNNINKAKDIVKKIFIYTNLIGFIVVIISILTKNIWFKFILEPSVINLFIYSLYMIFIIFTNSISGIHLLFISLGLVRYNLPIAVSVNIFYIVIIFYLINLYGLIGVIIALIIQASLVVCIKYCILKKITDQAGKSGDKCV